MIYRGDGHKQHNSLTNTQWQPAAADTHITINQAKKLAEKKREGERETCRHEEDRGGMGADENSNTTAFKIYTSLSLHCNTVQYYDK